MRRNHFVRAAALAAVAAVAAQAFANPNYIGAPDPQIGTPGPVVLTPEQTVGKEYAPGPSAYFPGGGNITVTPTPHAFDPHQVTAWDTNPLPVPAPGMADSSRDYTPFLAPELASTQIDALANHEDLFYAPPLTNSVVLDTSALIFSVTSDSGFAAGVGGAPILYERIALAGGGGGIWATPGQIAHTAHAGSPLPNDIGGDLDGLEVWGPDGAANDDSDRFSLNGLGGQDPGGIAVWAQNGGPAGAVTPLVTDLDIANLISQFTLGNVNPNILQQFVDLDALMMDDDGDNVLEPGIDRMLFSIRPIAGVFDGGEVWDTDFTVAGTSFLFHGGHLWNTAFSVMGAFGTVDENVDGLEAVAAIPEPTSLAAMVIGFAGLLIRRRSRKAD